MKQKRGGLKIPSLEREAKRGTKRGTGGQCRGCVHHVYTVYIPRQPAEVVENFKKSIPKPLPTVLLEDTLSMASVQLPAPFEAAAAAPSR